MVDSNLQREKILPSEKAFAYKMKMEALKRQGKRRDPTSEPAVPKLTAREKIAQDAGENCGLTVTRYMALTKLISPLLTLVDEDKLSFSTAADYIAILTEQEQTILVSVIDKLGVISTRSRLVKIKEQRKTEVLTIIVYRYNAAMARYDEVVTDTSAKGTQSERLANFIKVLKVQGGTISEFGSSLWGRHGRVRHSRQE